MADAEALRVQVRLSAELHPELFTALVSVRPRGRADRLRQLALVGADRSIEPPIRVIRAPRDQLPSPATPVDEQAAPPNPKRARILDTLTLAD